MSKSIIGRAWKMKIDPKKDYKKPLYAIALAAAIAASSIAVTSCENPLEPKPTLSGFVNITSFEMKAD